MLVGIVLKSLFRAPLKIVFTSAAQRRHTWFTRFLIARMDTVIATSQRSGGFLKVPHTVVMHSVDCERFQPFDGSGSRLEGMNPPARYMVGCFGRIRHQKGTDLFVDAMIRLLPDYPHWAALITGRVTSDHHEYHGQLRRKIARAGLERRIVFLGEVSDVRPWYRQLLLYVAPSRNEGFGLTPLEAMASGVAVIASDAGAHAETILEGVTGAVVPAGDGPALTEAIRRYMERPELAAEHGRNARVHVQGRFALDREASGLKSVYDRIWREGA